MTSLWKPALGQLEARTVNILQIWILLDKSENCDNFENLTLKGMTETYANTNTLPKEWKDIARISNDIPNTYEVSNYNHWLVVSTRQ